MKTRVLISLFCLLAPGVALANIQITEIMYDVPGSDAGHEWVEVTNTGSSPTDIAKFHLLEANTNHKLSVVAGSSLLAPGASAVIASKPSTFKTDWPDFAGTLFDSTFSLSNVGEALAITDASSTPQDSVTYAASLGAGGDGGSLHTSGDTFVSALPNPGVYPGTLLPLPQKTAPIPAAKKSFPKMAKNVLPLAPSTRVSTQTANVAAVAQAPTSMSVPPIFLWVVGLGAIILLGIAGVFIAGGKGKSLVAAEETSPRAEEFSIIND